MGTKICHGTVVGCADTEVVEHTGSGICVGEGQGVFTRWQSCHFVKVVRLSGVSNANKH